MADIYGKVPGMAGRDRFRTDIRGRNRHSTDQDFSKGQLQKDVLKVILHNCRIPDWNRGDFSSVVAACRTGANRCIEMAQRFGDDLYMSALRRCWIATTARCAKLILNTVPEDKRYFYISICDDGMGMGPYKIACTMWREGEKVIFDFDGTGPTIHGQRQSFADEQMFRMFCGQFMINFFDPQAIPFNDGFFDLIDVVIPSGLLLMPLKPAGLTSRTHALARIFDVLSGLLGQPIRSTCARPVFLTAPT